MPWQSSEYILGSKYEKDVNMPEYVWIYNNRQSSEYVSYST